MCFPEPPDSERGFVLIAAIWLLVLAGAIVALLMFATLTFAKRTRFEADQTASDLALQSALQTVAGDRLMNGVRGPWGLLPAESDVTVGDRLIHVRLTSEAGRLDINEADPNLIDAALRGLGADASARQAFVDSIAAIRLKHERIGSFDQLRAITRRVGLQLSTGVCAEDEMTFASGMSEPRPGQMPAELARVMGAPVSVTPGPGSGDALRFEASDSSGRVLRSVLRTRGGRIPLAISSMDQGSECSPRGPRDRGFDRVPPRGVASSGRARRSSGFGRIDQAAMAGSPMVVLSLNGATVSSAASKSAVRTIASPTLLTPPSQSVSPD